jgi:endoglucanase
LPIGACINLGNHFETPTGGEHSGKKLDIADLENIRAAGFDTVRMPVNWRSQSTPNPPYTINPQWLTRVTEMVDAAQAQGLNVILDNHNYFYNDSEANSKANAVRLAAIWMQLARHFASRSTAHLWFELDNEPNEPLNNDNLMETLGPSLAAIRSISRSRPVIIGGERSSRLESLATLKLPDDPSVWPTFHYYEPYLFTHQGATWGKGKSPPLGRRYGMPGDAERLAADVQTIRAYILRTGKIPFIGETGAIDTAPLPQRVAYVGAVHKAFSAIGVPQCYWGYTNTFPFYDYKTRTWLPGMLNAIGLQDPNLRRMPHQAK